MKSPLQWWRQRRVAAAVATLKATDKRDWWGALNGVGGVAGYAGASVGRLTASMASWSGAINQQNDTSLPILRARARDLAANTDFGARFVSMVANNVAGPCGPELQVRAVDGKGALDKPANDAIETHWEKWGDACDLAGVGFEQLMRVIVRAVAVDGEVIVRKVRGRAMPYGMGIRVLEADRLPETLNKRLENGNRIRQGVELDPNDRPVAYWIYREHPGETFGAGPREVERVPADQVFHLFVHTRPEQVRGVSWFHPVIMRGQMLHGFEEAAVIAARIGASKVAFFKRDPDSLPAGEQLATGTDSTGALHMSAEPGEFTELPAGYDIANWNPDYPHQNFESFVKQCMRGIAAGLNVATHNLAGDMTDVNYSSARIAEMAERDQWRALQEWYTDGFLEPLYEEWLSIALLRGDITMDLGTPLPPARLQKFTDAAEFRGRTWAWVDPLKEAEASILRLKNGLTSRTELALESGREFDDILGELAQEKDAIASAGVTLEPAAAAAPGQVTAPPAPSKSWEAAQARTLDAVARTLEQLGAVVGRLAQPAPIVVHTPAVDARTTVNLAPTEVSVTPTPVIVEAPAVHVENRVDTPVVNLEATLTPPAVHIENRIEQPPLEVNVNLPARQTVTQVQRDDLGRLTGATQVESDVVH